MQGDSTQHTWTYNSSPMMQDMLNFMQPRTVTGPIAWYAEIWRRYVDFLAHPQQSRHLAHLLQVLYEAIRWLLKTHHLAHSIPAQSLART